MALFQDVALEPFYGQTLSLTAYYKSYDQIVVPSPNSLLTNTMGTEGPEENQQMRVDVIRPGPPIFTVAPADILATPFASKPGDPETLAPTRYSVDLTPFAGQIVRIRIAAAAGDYFLNAGVDDVAITSTPPNNVVKKGKLKLNKKKGTATLSVTVPGAGVLTFADARKGKKKVLKPKQLTVSGQGTVKVTVKPNGKGKKALKKKGKLQFKGTLGFTPTGGTLGSKPVQGKLKLAGPERK